MDKPYIFSLLTIPFRGVVSHFSQYFSTVKTEEIGDSSCVGDNNYYFPQHSSYKSISYNNIIKMLIVGI